MPLLFLPYNYYCFIQSVTKNNDMDVSENQFFKKIQPSMEARDWRGSVDS